jgi:hypothetical protein
MKVSGQSHALAAFRLGNIDGTNSIGGSVDPRAGLGLSGKRKLCFLCRDLNTVLPSPWLCTSSSQFHS